MVNINIELKNNQNFICCFLYLLQRCR